MTYLGISYDAVAAEINVSKRTLCEYVRSGYFQKYGENKGTRITMESLVQWRWWQNTAWPDSVIPTGYIYLLYSRKLHKIGLSKDVDSRLKQIRAMSSTPVFLLHQIPTNNMHRSEMFLHSLFAGRRKHGEWFHLTPTDVRLFSNCKALYFN